MVDYETAVSLVASGGYKLEAYDGKHYAKLLTSDGHFVDWVQKPGSRKAREHSRYSLQDVMRFHGFDGEPFCFVCRRKQSELGIGESLELDHILPIREGGEDELGNLQILCSACHRLRHWMELYVTKHLIRREKLTDKGGDSHEV